ncbi:MAG: amino acid ABC transporter permease [Reyranella sp.]
MAQLTEFLPAIGQGMLMTVLIGVLSIAGCVPVSLILGICRRARNGLVRSIAGSIVELLRGASVLIYLFWVYYALPAVPGMPHFDPVAVSIVVLSLVGGAYGAEIVSSGLQAVPRGQAEAGQALGLSKYRTFSLIVIPQALSQIVPAFSSLAIDMVKWTSVASFVGVQDLLSVANMIRTSTYATVSTYVGVGALYFLLCLLTSWLFRLIERGLPLNRALRAAGPSGAKPGMSPLVLNSEVPQP